MLCKSRNCNLHLIISYMLFINNMKPCDHWSLQVHGLDTLHLLASSLVVVAFILFIIVTYYLLHVIYINKLYVPQWLFPLGWRGLRKSA